MDHLVPPWLRKPPNVCILCVYIYILYIHIYILYIIIHKICCCSCYLLWLSPPWFTPPRGCDQHTGASIKRQEVPFRTPVLVNGGKIGEFTAPNSWDQELFQQNQTSGYNFWTSYTLLYYLLIWNSAAILGIVTPTTEQKINSRSHSDASTTSIPWLGNPWSRNCASIGKSWK